MKERQTMQGKEVVITYETLFEFLKRETDRVELQGMEASFFADVVAYLREKQTLQQKAAAQSYEEQVKVQRELDNIKKILKDLYDRREKKIVRMAIDESRTKSNLVDMSAMLKEERDLFEHVRKTLEGFRSGLLQNMMEGKMPAVYTALERAGSPSGSDGSGSGSSASAPSASDSASSSSASQDPAASPPPPVGSGNDEAGAARSDAGESSASDGLSQDEENQEFRDTPAPATSTGQDSGSSEGAATKLVRFLNPVPKFVGAELEEYGPFDEDDIASLPGEVADVLLSKGRVEEIKEQ